MVMADTSLGGPANIMWVIARLSSVHRKGFWHVDIGTEFAREIQKVNSPPSGRLFELTKPPTVNPPERQDFRNTLICLTLRPAPIKSFFCIHARIQETIKCVKSEISAVYWFHHAQVRGAAVRPAQDFSIYWAGKRMQARCLKYFSTPVGCSIYGVLYLYPVIWNIFQFHVNGDVRP